MLQTTIGSSYTHSVQDEYVIYAHYHTGRGVSAKWKRITAGCDAQEMKRIGHDLFRSQAYDKIEIQKKYYDKKSGCQKVSTFCTFEEKKKIDYFILSSVSLLSFASLGLLYLSKL